jgi:hypothetical protein
MTTVYALQPCDATVGLDFCNYSLQSVHDGKTDPKFTFFTDETWFYMNGHVNTEQQILEHRKATSPT